jgi:hypothetical protein
MLALGGVHMPAEVCLRSAETGRRGNNEARQDVPHRFDGSIPKRLCLDSYFPRAIY